MFNLASLEFLFSFFLQHHAAFVVVEELEVGEVKLRDLLDGVFGRYRLVEDAEDGELEDRLFEEVEGEILGEEFLAFLRILGEITDLVLI